MSTSNPKEAENAKRSTTSQRSATKMEKGESDNTHIENTETKEDEKISPDGVRRSTVGSRKSQEEVKEKEETAEDSEAMSNDLKKSIVSKEGPRSSIMSSDKIKRLSASSEVKFPEETDDSDDKKPSKEGSKKSISSTEKSKRLSTSSAGKSHEEHGDNRDKQSIQSKRDSHKSSIRSSKTSKKQSVEFESSQSETKLSVQSAEGSKRASKESSKGEVRSSVKSKPDSIKSAYESPKVSQEKKSIISKHSRESHQITDTEGVPGLSDDEAEGEYIADEHPDEEESALEEIDKKEEDFETSSRKATGGTSVLSLKSLSSELNRFETMGPRCSNVPLSSLLPGLAQSYLRLKKRAKTYQLDPKIRFSADFVKEILRQTLRDVKNKMVIYDEGQAARLASSAANEIRNGVVQLHFDRYRIGVMVVITEKLQHGYRIDMQPLWDNMRDGMATYIVHAQTYVMMAACYGLYKD